MKHHTFWSGVCLSGLIITFVSCADPSITEADTSSTSGSSSSESDRDVSSSESSEISSSGPSESDSTTSDSTDASSTQNTTDSTNVTGSTTLDPQSSSGDTTSTTTNPTSEGSDVTGTLDESSGDGIPDEHSWDGCDTFIMPADCTIPDGAVLPEELRCTGLYSDWENRELRCGVEPFEPTYPLWTDGAGKQRYVWMPPETTVDVSDPDDFQFPVGTRMWKEFHVGEPGQQRIGETRLLLKVDAGWLYTAYVWSEDGQTAIQNNDGVDDLFGTGHSVPSREQCKTCHEGRPDFILGWDFVMLGGRESGFLQTLADEGRLSGLSDDALLDMEIPGDDTERAALGYLHANCGISCHNATVFAAANSSGLYMRLNVGELESPHTTATVLSGINKQPGPNADYGDLAEPGLQYYDFRPLDPTRSLALARMDYRGSETAMPPLGTHVVDPHGIDVVTAWIESMTEERGYPPPAE